MSFSEENRNESSRNEKMQRTPGLCELNLTLRTLREP